MKCAQIQKRLAVMALGLLSEKEAQETSAHAEACAACGRELARLRAADQALAASSADIADVDLTARVFSRIARPRTNPRSMWWVPLAAGAAMLAAVFVAPWAWRPEPLSMSEVLQEYNEDLSALSPWETAATAETAEPTWGFPTELAQWINSN